MKFTRYLEANKEPAWEDKYIRYRELKKLIAQILEEGAPVYVPTALSLTVGREREDARSTPQEQFFLDLEADVKRINDFTTGTATALRSQLRDVSVGLAGSDLSDGAARERWLVVARRLGESYLRLEKYVNINYAGLQKILKKHDKMLPEAPCAHFYKVHINRQPWVRGDHHDIQVTLSRIFSQLHSAATAAAATAAAAAAAQAAEAQAAAAQAAAAARAGPSTSASGSDSLSLPPIAQELSFSTPAIAPSASGSASGGSSTGPFASSSAAAPPAVLGASLSYTHHQPQPPVFAGPQSYSYTTQYAPPPHGLVNPPMHPQVFAPQQHVLHAPPLPHGHVPHPHEAMHVATLGYPAAGPYGRSSSMAHYGYPHVGGNQQLNPQGQLLAVHHRDFYQNTFWVRPQDLAQVKHVLMQHLQLLPPPINATGGAPGGDEGGGGRVGIGEAQEVTVAGAAVGGVRRPVGWGGGRGGWRQQRGQQQAWRERGGGYDGRQPGHGPRHRQHHVPGQPLPGAVPHSAVRQAVRHHAAAAVVRQPRARDGGGDPAGAPRGLAAGGVHRGQLPHSGDTGGGLPQRPVDMGRRAKAHDGRGGGPHRLPQHQLQQPPRPRRRRRRPPRRGPQQQPVRQLLRRRCRTVVLVKAASWGPRGAGAGTWESGVACGVVWGRLGRGAAVEERALRRRVRWRRVRTTARPDAPGAGVCAVQVVHGGGPSGGEQGAAAHGADPLPSDRLHGAAGGVRSQSGDRGGRTDAAGVLVRHVHAAVARAVEAGAPRGRHRVPVRRPQAAPRPRRHGGPQVAAGAAQRGRHSADERLLQVPALMRRPAARPGARRASVGGRPGGAAQPVRQRGGQRGPAGAAAGRAQRCGGAGRRCAGGRGGGPEAEEQGRQGQGGGRRRPRGQRRQHHGPGGQGRQGRGLARPAQQRAWEGRGRGGGRGSRRRGRGCGRERVHGVCGARGGWRAGGGWESGAAAAAQPAAERHEGGADGVGAGGRGRGAGVAGQAAAEAGAAGPRLRSAADVCGPLPVPAQRAHLPAVAAHSHHRGRPGNGPAGLLRHGAHRPLGGAHHPHWRADVVRADDHRHRHDRLRHGRLRVAQHTVLRAALHQV